MNRRIKILLYEIRIGIVKCIPEVEKCQEDYLKKIFDKYEKVLDYFALLCENIFSYGVGY